MTEKTGHTLVIVSLVGLAAYILIRNPGKLKQGQTYKRLWALGLLGLALGALADVAPQFAGPFALMLLVGGVAINEGVIGKQLSAGLSGSGVRHQ